MDKIFVLIYENMNLAINIFGVVILVLIVKNAVNLSIHKKQIEEAVQRKNTRSYFNKRTKSVEDRDESEAVTPDTIREYEKKFNKYRSGYSVLAQIIPIFPLLGILGTVSGLINMADNGNIAANESMAQAMYTTFFGLIWTIGLKILIAITSSRFIDDADIILDDYDKKVNNSYILKNIIDE